MQLRATGHQSVLADLYRGWPPCAEDSTTRDQGKMITDARLTGAQLRFAGAAQAGIEFVAPLHKI